jgi:hypothetical protein
VRIVLVIGLAATTFAAALIAGYLGSAAGSAGGGRFRYGEVAPRIGYLYIATFEDEDFKRIDAWARDIDTVMTAVAMARARSPIVQGLGGYLAGGGHDGPLSFASLAWRPYDRGTEPWQARRRPIQYRCSPATFPA